MTPVILESESGGLLVIGGSGGSMITSAVALVSPLKPLLHVRPPHLLLLRQAVLNRLWLKMSLKDAITMPIVYVDSENNVKFEGGFDEVRKSAVLILTGTRRRFLICLRFPSGCHRWPQSARTQSGKLEAFFQRG